MRVNLESLGKPRAKCALCGEIGVPGPNFPRNLESGRYNVNPGGAKGGVRYCGVAATRVIREIIAPREL